MKTTEINKLLALIPDTPLAKEINALLSLVPQVAKKVMKFISNSKISTGKETINLVDFYKMVNKNQPLYFWGNFIQILNEATENGAVPTVEIDETFYQYQNTEGVTDNDAIAELKESIIDLGTAEGRLEARKRLGVMAYFLKKQPKAEKGQLLTNGNANVIGWFKLNSGSVLSAGCRWYSYDQEWGCLGRGLGKWHAEHGFWSRNEIQ